MYYQVGSKKGGGNHKEYDSRSQYSNFVKDMLSSSNEAEDEGYNKFKMHKIETHHKYNTATAAEP